MPEIEVNTDDEVITVTIPDDATGYVIVKVGDVEYAINATAGEKSIKVDGLSPGEYEVVATYLGDEKYLENAVNATLKISKKDPNMNESVENETYDSAEIVVVLPEDATGTITVTVDGKNYTVEAKGGENIISIPDLTSGNHTATVTYSGDDKYNPDASEKTIDIPKKAIGTVIVVDKKFTRVANDYNAGERGGYFYAILMDTEGNSLPNKTVQIAVNGPVYDVITDEYGRAALKIKLANANTYTYALFFQGDETYNASHIASSKLTVTKKATSITASDKSFKASASTKTVSVKLKTSKNPYDGKTYLSAGKKITLKINGKTYTAKTNSNGVASFSIKLTKKGSYTAKISFASDKTYKASSNSISVKIK